MGKEENTSRSDIVEQEIVERLFDIGHVKFEDYIKIFSEFFDDLVIRGYLLERLSVKEIVRAQVESYLGVIRRYAAGEDVCSEMKRFRIAAWKEFDRQDGVDKAVLRAVLIGLYDEESAKYDDEDSLPNFEIIFSTLNDIADDLCRCFREFLVHSVVMSRYRI